MRLRWDHAGGSGIGVSGGANLRHSLRQLLVQLSSIHGDIFENEEQRGAYASFLVEGATAVLSSPLVATVAGACIANVLIGLRVPMFWLFLSKELLGWAEYGYTFYVITIE